MSVVCVEIMRALAIALLSVTLTTQALADVSADHAAAAVAPPHTFRVDQEINTPDGASLSEYTTWLVSTVDPARRERLPEIALDDVSAGITSGTVGYESDFVISPDERFILRDQKLYHGANALYLYTRVRGLAYRAARHARIDRAVKRFFARAVGGREIEQMGIVEFVRWSDDGKSVIVSLRGREVAGYDVVGWQCTFELAGGRVRVSAAQAKANAGTYEKSSAR
jgi:hypothetical protein